MIKSTPKADTLPEDLRKHWEDAMADKFPMTIDEACGYIASHYGLDPRIIDSVISITVRVRGYAPQSSPGGFNQIQQIYETVSYDEILIDDFRKSVIDEKLKEYKK